MWNKRGGSSNGGSPTSVTTSSNNGKIKVNETELTVYDDSVLNAKATHSNRSTLDKLSDSGTTLLFNGQPVTGSGTGGTAVSRISGKKWNCMGDSITAELEGYHKWLAINYGVIPTNYGVSATTVGIRAGRTDSMLERYPSMTDDADIITVLGGTNDLGAAQPVPVGTLGNGDNTTFYGAYESLLRGLITKYPGKSIAVFTPLPRRSDTGSLATYADAVIKVAAKFAVPCLDLYRSAGLDPHFDIINTTFFKSQDGLHPNAEGHKIIARRMISFLESI